MPGFTLYSDPGGEVAAVPEQLRIEDERAKRGRADKPNAWNALQKLALIILLMPGLKPLCDVGELPG